MSLVPHLLKTCVAEVGVDRGRALRHQFVAPDDRVKDSTAVEPAKIDATMYFIMRGQ